MKVRLLGFISHVVKDVRPWSRRYRDWRIYHSLWPPDNANQCPLLHVEAGEGGGAFAWRQEPEQTTSGPDQTPSTGGTDRGNEDSARGAS